MVTMPRLQSKVIAFNDEPYSKINIFLTGTDLDELTYYFSNDGGANYQEVTLTFNIGNTVATGSYNFNTSSKLGILYRIEGYFATIDFIKIDYS